MSGRSWVLGLVGLAVLPLASCSSRDTVTLQGCGATFPAPVYKRWFLEFYRGDPNVRTNYQAIGSGAGIRQFREGLVHFGASDEALSKKKLDEVATDIERREGKRPELIQVPLTAGAVALCFNVPGVSELRLSRPTYAGIILGEIEDWDHAEVRRDNPRVELPSLKITFIRRAESSGTTFVFTNHLNAIDSRWASKRNGPGVGKSVQWPIGLGGKGNSGVAALIGQTPGALGYIESGYAKITELPMAALQNRAGEFVKPDEKASLVALEEARFDEVFGSSVPDPKGRGAYPIVSLTWVVCRRHYDDPRVAEKLREVFLYCLGEGQGLSEEVGYVPLPTKTRERLRGVVKQIGSEAETANATPPMEKRGP